MTAIAIQAALLLACLSHEASSFSVAPRSTLKPLQLHPTHHHSRNDDGDYVDDPSSLGHHAQTRRFILHQGLLATTIAVTAATTAERADALGSLPEFSDANAILQSLTIDVTDKDQYEETIEFFTSAFDGMKVLRDRNGGGVGGGVVKDTWLGFGPETLSTPPNFELGVSSLSQYGGHAALHLRYDPASTAPLYKKSSSGEMNTVPAPGNSVAYLQLGVTTYRISQMVKNGGNVLDAYGWVNVVSPAGLPIRAIVGVSADPMMFLAVNCNDVGKSEEFYAKLGFARQEYPYARLNQGQGQFEPPQPPKSVYLAPSTNSMGILLLQNAKRKKAVAPNPVLRSLNVVYAPPEGGADGSGGGTGSLAPDLIDPSSVPISFISEDFLEKEIKRTAIP